MHPCIHADIRTCMSVYGQTHVDTHVSTHTCGYTRQDIQQHTHASGHTHVDTACRRRTSRWMVCRSSVCTRMHTLTRTHTHTHTRNRDAPTRSNTPPLPRCDPKTRRVVCQRRRGRTLGVRLPPNNTMRARSAADVCRCACIVCMYGVDVCMMCTCIVSTTCVLSSPP